jgi:hypothetical protein
LEAEIVTSSPREGVEGQVLDVEGDELGAPQRRGEPEQQQRAVAPTAERLSEKRVVDVLQGRVARSRFPSSVMHQIQHRQHLAGSRLVVFGSARL